MGLPGRTTTLSRVGLSSTGTTGTDSNTKQTRAALTLADLVRAGYKRSLLMQPKHDAAAAAHCFELAVEIGA